MLILLDIETLLDSTELGQQLRKKPPDSNGCVASPAVAGEV